MGKRYIAKFLQSIYKKLAEAELVRQKENSCFSRVGDNPFHGAGKQQRKRAFTVIPRKLPNQM